MLRTPRPDSHVHSRTLHLALLITSWLVYGLNRINRPTGSENLIRDSLPSLLFPLVCFSLVAVLPQSWGGNDGQPLCSRNILIGTLAACLIFEGLGPYFGLGRADPVDAIALILGAILYRLFSALAKQQK